jgi:hypothetical protein
MATGTLITHVFVGVPVTNYASARKWYEQFFGRPPDVVPKEDEAVWQVTTTGLIYHDEPTTGALSVSDDV